MIIWEYQSLLTIFFLPSRISAASALLCAPLRNLPRIVFFKSGWVKKTISMPSHWSSSISDKGHWYSNLVVKSLNSWSSGRWSNQSFNQSRTSEVVAVAGGVLSMKCLLGRMMRSGRSLKGVLTSEKVLKSYNIVRNQCCAILRYSIVDRHIDCFVI